MWIRWGTFYVAFGQGRWNFLVGVMLWKTRSTFNQWGERVMPKEEKHLE